MFLCISQTMTKQSEIVREIEMKPLLQQTMFHISAISMTPTFKTTQPGKQINLAASDESFSALLT